MFVKRERSVHQNDLEGGKAFILSKHNWTLLPQSKKLENLFEEIVTNPAEWDPSGLLRLKRRVDPNGPQHNCTVGCSPNMCKGALQRDP